MRFRLFFRGLGISRQKKLIFFPYFVLEIISKYKQDSPRNRTIFIGRRIINPVMFIRVRNKETRARTFKCLWGPGIDSKEWITPTFEVWRAGTKTLFLLGA
jgi:hypothetical protein